MIELQLNVWTLLVTSFNRVITKRRKTEFLFVTAWAQVVSFSLLLAAGQQRFLAITVFNRTRTFARWRHFTAKTSKLGVFSFFFRYLFPLGISKTSGPNYITKESGQSILVVVVYDAIMQMA